ncbi:MULTISPECIES: Stk1 family PASTA domain-containing Ser/Thr kinase [Exiguobacterium]|uniref:Stk1 family PASTA domain-containing Ser/Thr kinase n=1 Tax=Exiguobacterium TaxID=33986 RepID=UPI0008776739|nr:MULTISPECIES: Stk1 family PASTA domain-containing Ser/Thr kinase [Exiguobacterium]TCI37394.1 Stk1 family PASTA domain-containing Ser/Thr kinase [Exiguobacterium sp. SH4S7]TCI45607.1 Stk1 family PASTA domain-containing Ser/Thr kinase [Exiguobacterium sp. SH5S32]TCI52726.1 Stk1 family PASTA domain-containing Ser/Thr kinase [Exiguobacterium sp. SH1S4]TCI65497.1 Stk1 family PASTA domain-containing Ser/Thr kinase [Exiguobacterium sp. SH0S2]TCI70915.1 Stk1 family PASTA domain-containing Ser/Thr k
MRSGERINDRYRIEQQIGSGGMANVYRAHDEILNRTVAIKVLRSEFSHNEQFIRRFEREAHAATSLNHPNIVAIYDVGDEQDIYYIVMEHVDGMTLKQYLQEEYISIEEALRIMGQICDAIDHAHAHRIIHRDIKPQNMMIDQNGNVKVTDFGIAVAMSNATLTHTMSVLGSVHYFSPEQARGKFADEKSDIYSLGAVLYELVTGRVPFIGETPVAVALQHLQDDPIRPLDLNPKIPQALENCIMQALAKSPGARHASVAAFKKDCLTSLSPDRADEPKRMPTEQDEFDQTLVMAPVVPEEPKEVVKQPAAAVEPESATPKKQKKKKWWLWLLLVLLLIGGGVAAYVVADEMSRAVVPDVVGMSVGDATTELEASGFVVETTDRVSDNVSEGDVISQNPQPGRKPKRGTVVTIVVSAGKETVEMPDVEGLSQTAAERTLKDLDFTDIEIQSEASETVDSGDVISQSITPGEEVIASEETVTLVVSTGSNKIELANLTGYTFEEASTYAEQNNLKIVKRDEYSTSIPANQIIRQLPTSGTAVDPGTELTVIVSQGVEPTDISIEREVDVEIEPPAEGEEAEPVEVVIRTVDARGEIEVLRDMITETTTYSYTLVIAPDEVGTATIEVEGEVVRTDTVTYAQAKDSQ